MDPKHIYKSLGETIRRYRRGIPRTQEQLAAEVGISRASLANIEAGRQQVLLHHLYSIADALQLDSPTALLPAATESSRAAGDATGQLPLPEQGLSEVQRKEVLQLLGGSGEPESIEPLDND